MISSDLPLGFGMALAQHPDAMDKFAHMTDMKQDRIMWIQKAAICPLWMHM